MEHLKQEWPNSWTCLSNFVFDRPYNLYLVLSMMLDADADAGRATATKRSVSMSDSPSSTKVCVTWDRASRSPILLGTAVVFLIAEATHESRSHDASCFSIRITCSHA